MTETTITDAAATTALEALANRPLILDEYPVNDEGDLTINVWIREADQVATMRVTDEDENEDGETVTNEIDAYLNNEDLFELALTAGRALAKLGHRDDLAELIKGLTDELLASK